MENRRHFLKKGMAGLTGAALLPALGHGLSERGSAALPERTLGKTGIKTPLLSMGTAGATSAGLIKAGYEAGIKLFFSATYYGEGNNEKLAGDALRGLPRDSFVVGSAVPPDGFDNRTGKFIQPFDSQAYLRKTDDCLKRFGFDHLDILLFPYAGKKEMVLNEEVLKALSDIKRQGKAKLVGIASHSDTIEALDAASGSGFYDVAMIAYNYKVKDPAALNAAIDRAAAAGMGIVAMKSTAGAARDKSGTPVNITAALKWVLQNKNISTIVSGMSSTEEMQRNLAMIQDIRMTEQEVTDLKLAAVNNENGLYCLQCGNCISGCPRKLDIPSAMRSYMYAYGYKDLPHAWHTLAAAEFPVDPCGDCKDCVVSCSAGFDIRNKLQDIARLRDVPRDLILA